MLDRPYIAVLAAAVALTGCKQGQSSIEATCPAFAYVDHTAPMPRLNDDPTEERLDVIWKRWSNVQPDVAWRTPKSNATIHFETDNPAAPFNAGMSQYEIVGRRGYAGWEVHGRSGNLAPQGLTWGSWRPVRLSTEAASRLDAALLNPCLWDAPPYLNGEVRLRNGRYDSRPDGPTTFYDVSMDKRRWGGLHFSWTVGTPGELRGILLSEAFGLPQHLDKIDPEGWIDKP